MAGLEVLLVTIELIGLTKLDGRAAYVNPEQIVQLAEPKPDGTPGKQFVDAVGCVITMTDNTYVTVEETCEQIRRILTEETQ